MREQVFNTEVINSLRDAGAWAYKIPDMPSSLMVGGRFNPDKPCDIIACFKSRFIGIEGKMLKGFKGFSLSLFRNSQIKSLDEMVDSDGLAFAFINIRITQAPRENRLIIINWSLWRNVLERKTIPKSLVERLPHIKGKKGRFDLKDFVSLIGKGMVYGFGPSNYKEDLIERRIRK